MTVVSRWLARRFWWGILWLMRKPWMRRAQEAPLQWFSESFRSRALESNKRQNALARKIGLPLLTVLIDMIIAVCAISVAVQLLLMANDQGWLQAPDTLIEKTSSY